MYILILLLGFLPFFIAIQLVASHAGGTIGLFYDSVSLIIVPIAPFLIAVGVTKKFKLDIDGYKLFGDLCIGCALIGTIIGMVGIFYGWGAWDADVFYEKLGRSLAIAILTILYGLIGKYLIALPMIACKKNC